jgi:hypothetical protein
MFMRRTLPHEHVPPCQPSMKVIVDRDVARNHSHEGRYTGSRSAIEATREALYLHRLVFQH